MNQGEPASISMCVRGTVWIVESRCCCPVWATGGLAPHLGNYQIFLLTSLLFMRNNDR